MKQTTGKFWRRFHLVALIVWLGPGAVVSLILKDSVAWVVFLSIYAIWVSHAAGYSAARAEEASE